MKRLILILLILVVCVSIFATDVVLAKVNFGNWNRWDEELPPATNSSWHWAIKTNEPRVFTLKGRGGAGSDVVLLFSDTFFYKDKKGKTKASVLFYSVDGDKKDWDIPNASLALVAFPPKKKKIIIRAYKMENQGFKFFEEWQIPFKNHQVVVPEDAKFRQIFKEWLEKQVASGETIPEDKSINFMLPELVIWEKIFFMIINVTESQING